MKREEETTHPCYKPVRKTKKHIAEEAKRFSFLYPSESKEIFFIYGAEWADKRMLDRACEWLKENIDLYAYESSNTHYPEIKLTECFETAFRRAMKGGAE